MNQSIELLDPEPAVLPVETRAAVALKSSETELQLRALAAKNTSIVAIVDKPGREQAHGAAMELKRTRTAIQAVSKTARDDATKFSKAVIAEEARLVAIIEPEETRLLALRDGWDSEQARIKAEREAAERARIMAINEKIAHLRGFVSLALECRTSERVASLIARLNVELSEDDYQEFIGEATQVRDAAIARMVEIHDARVADEAERARVKADQKAAAEKLAFERRLMEEERAAIQADLDKAADKVRAAAEEMAAQRAAFEAEQEAARKNLVAQASLIALERAALEAAKTTPETQEEQPLAHVECAQAAIETVALSEGLSDLLDSRPMELSSQPMSIAIDPPSPTVEALIQAVADTFGVSLNTAADWLTNAADDIANFE